LIYLYINFLFSNSISKRRAASAAAVEKTRYRRPTGRSATINTTTAAPCRTKNNHLHHNIARRGVYIISRFIYYDTIHWHVLISSIPIA